MYIKNKTGPSTDPCGTQMLGYPKQLFVLNFQDSF